MDNFDSLDVKLVRAGRRAAQIRFHQLEFKKSCARKEETLKRQCVRDHGAKPRRRLRTAVRTAIARNSLQHSDEFPRLSMGMAGVRMLPLSMTLVETEIAVLMVEDVNAKSEVSWSDDQDVAAPLITQVSDIVKDAIKQPRVSLKRPAVLSDADTSASEHVSESESRGSLEAPSSLVEELHFSKIVPSEKVQQDAPKMASHGESGQFISETQRREELLRRVVIQLKSQRTAVENENARLQQELIAKNSLQSTVETSQPQLCFKEAKQFDQQRSKRIQKQLKQHRQQEQQRHFEIEAARCESERRASEITARAIAHASAIRVAAEERSAAIHLTLLQKKMEQQELQKSIEHQQSMLAAMTEQQQRVLKDLDDTHVKASTQLVHIQSELREILASKDQAEAAASQASEQLQVVLAAAEEQKQKLHAIAAKETTTAATVKEPPATVQDRCSRQSIRNSAAASLKSAKELDRQRALKQSKQAAHQRLLKRQKEAERCRMREEIEKERAIMLSAAEQELAAVKARIKSQSEVLRKKKRRATSSARRSESIAEENISGGHDRVTTCEENRCEDLAQPQGMPAAGESCFDSPDHQDEVSSVESNDVILDSNEDDGELEAEGHSQQQAHEGEALEEDWQVLSEGSEDDEALWDLVG
jgi:myosin heavy subunit